ncbi:MAG: hypothetical protein H6606_00580 [Flavobacteriales bacterium]|nr:hypothetical protein [Flavobacteriales bacterium]
MNENDEHIETKRESKGSGGSESTSVSMFQWMGYLAFLTVLTIPYIYNAHRAEKKLRLKEKLSEQTEELRSEYITLKSEVIGKHKQSDITRILSDRDLHELSDPPIDLNKNLEH